MTQPADLRRSVPPTTVLGYPHAEEATEHHPLRFCRYVGLHYLIAAFACSSTSPSGWHKAHVQRGVISSKGNTSGTTTLRCGPLRQTCTREPDGKEMRSAEAKVQEFQVETERKYDAAKKA